MSTRKKLLLNQRIRTSEIEISVFTGRQPKVKIQDFYICSFSSIILSSSQFESCRNCISLTVEFYFFKIIVFLYIINYFILFYNVFVLFFSSFEFLCLKVVQIVCFFIAEILPLPLPLPLLLLLSIAVIVITLIELCAMGIMQRRRGPNDNGGDLGMFQPISDDLKLVLKDNVNADIFMAAPLYTLLFTVFFFMIQGYKTMFSLIKKWSR